MLCGKQDYLGIETTHNKVLKIVYSSKECYEELLICNNEVSIHIKQFHTLATEIYKTLTDKNPDFIKTIFQLKKYLIAYKYGTVLKIPSTRPTYYETNSIHFLANLL